MPTRLSSAVLLLVLSACGGLLAQSSPTAPPPLHEMVQGYVSRHQFMGTVLVEYQGQLLLNQGYGAANLEWNIPNAPSTRFRLASLTKQFTAAGILLLAQRGQLRVDDPISQHLPHTPSAWAAVTIFHLLTHTAGIPNLTSFAEFAATKGKDTTPVELIARFRDRPLDFAPGTEHRYSNSGYILLGHLLETVSHQSYGDFLQEHVFTPLGMADTGVDRNTAILPRRAQGYTVGKVGLVHAAHLSMTIPFAAGNLYSTSEDLRKWEHGLWGGKLLSAASLAQIKTPFKSEYALGLRVFRQPDGHLVVRHSGGIDGFSTELAHFPEDGLTVIVLSNVETVSASRLARDLAAKALGGSPAP